MTRIPPPAWAPPYARHTVEAPDADARRAVEVARPLLPRIYEELDRRVSAFANDPEQCFLHASDGFPLRERLAGRYYIGRERYEGAPEGRGGHRLWLEVRCLEKPWLAGQPPEGDDYLGLEAIVTLDEASGTFAFDDGFNTSVI
jgi:hypothetical protein